MSTPTYSQQMREVYRWVGHLGNLPLGELREAPEQSDDDRQVLELAQRFHDQYLAFAEARRR